MAPTAPKPADVKQVDAPARKIVARAFGEDETKAMKTGTPETSPVVDIVRQALDTGLAQGIGYGDEYKKSTVLAHIRKALDKTAPDFVKVPEGKVLRTFDRANYIDPDTGQAWPHIGLKFVDKPPAKNKPTTDNTPAPAAPAGDVTNVGAPE